MTVPRGSPALLSGWGRTAPTAAELVPAVHPDVVGEVLGQAVGPAESGRGVIARGLGRSYGDAAQNAGGTVLDATGLDGFHSVDLDRGVVTVGAGVSLQALMERLVPLGWFVPVSPGTRQVTVGGAIAADIHGKNHHADGSFCSHVVEATLATPTGTPAISPTADPDLFWATAGGMGLTGVILDATIRLIPVESSYVLVDTDRAPDLDAAMDLMTTGDDAYRYSVAWIDCQATGGRLGRSVLTRGNHAPLDALPARLRREPARARAFSPRSLARVPLTPPGGLLNPVTVGAFNELWFRKAPRHQTAKPLHIASFFHPLDGVADWNRLYGRRGFLQYQLVVPDDRSGTVRRVIEHLSRLRLASFLAVLKRFGPGNPGPLSFPAPGWTLALDLPVGRQELPALLDQLDEEVVEAGGRVYLAKDSRVSPAVFRAMYPRLDEWRAVRERVDPQGIMQSDLGRRLGLCGSRPTMRPPGPARAPGGRRNGSRATRGQTDTQGRAPRGARAGAGASTTKPKAKAKAQGARAATARASSRSGPGPEPAPATDTGRRTP